MPGNAAEPERAFSRNHREHEINRFISAADKHVVANFSNFEHSRLSARCFFDSMLLMNEIRKK